MRRVACCVALVCLVNCGSLLAGDKLPLRVLYLARDYAPTRTQAFEPLLQQHFAKVAVIRRPEFKPAEASDFDVVVLDWSQDEKNPSGYPSPLGPLEAWDKPTVLLGSAGHLLAGPWRIPGGAGCTCLAPFVYQLGDHPIARGPVPVDLTKTVRTATPQDWIGEVKDSHIEVLPLVDESPHNVGDGWCCYTYEHAQAPEIEQICGGINHKTPRAGAIWRQGNLLHFGFEEVPPRLNATGQALLINSIVYIAKCAADRPILRTPSPFYSKSRLIDRDLIKRAIARMSGNWQEYLEYFTAPETFAEIKELDDTRLLAWFEQVRPFFNADDQGRLTVDQQARKFGTSPAEPAFFDAALAALAAGGDAEATARELLGRYVPEGPDAKTASADQWRQWWQENRDYLFFADTGGYRWYLDPLARQRRVPTREFRGAARIAPAKFAEK